MRLAFFVGVVLLALHIVVSCAGCIGYGEFISPKDAYDIETKRCETKRDAEERRICLGFVGRKYGRYNAEGGYPEYPSPPPVR